jgi:hypothetical protein
LFESWDFTKRDIPDQDAENRSRPFERERERDVLSFQVYRVILFQVILYGMHYRANNTTYVSSIRIFIERMLNNTQFQNIRMVNSLLQSVLNWERAFCPDGNRIVM